MTLGGMFSHRTGTRGGAAIKLRHQKQHAQLVDHFAEHLSQHGDIARAAAQLGRSASWGRATFRRICDELGGQAR